MPSASRTAPAKLVPHGLRLLTRHDTQFSNGMANLMAQFKTSVLDTAEIILGTMSSERKKPTLLEDSEQGLKNMLSLQSTI